MYDLIYNFLLDHLFNGSLEGTYTIGGETITANEWLAHTCTIVSMGLIFAFCVMMIIFVFKFVGGLIGGIGR